MINLVIESMPKYDSIFVHARLYFHIHFLALFYGDSRTPNGSSCLSSFPKLERV